MNPLPNKKTTAFLNWLILGLACLGVADSIYLLVYRLTSLNSMCLGSGGCKDVNFSPYAVIGGIPVSVFGIIAYLVIAGIVIGEPRIKILKGTAALVLFGISLGGVAFSAYLTWLELYVIHATCPFCVASAIIITAIFILSIVRLIHQNFTQEE